MYRIFNISLDSDIPLPELPEINQGDKVLYIRAGSQIIKDNLQPIWFHDWLDANNEVCISCARVNEDYLLRFPDVADFLISLSDKSIIYLTTPDIPDETIRHLLLDQVVPRVLGQQGMLIAHASAVRLTDGHSIAFLGNSGCGKSTIASSYHEADAELITDDCLMIDTINGVNLGIPSYYGLRLFEDSVNAIFNEQPERSPVAHNSDKKRIRLHNNNSKLPSAGVPLNAVFLLGDLEIKPQSSEIVIESVKGTYELISLVEKMFVLDITEKQLIARQFKNISKIISANLPIYRLQYPHEHTQLPMIHKTISEVLLRQKSCNEQNDKGILLG